MSIGINLVLELRPAVPKIIIKVPGFSLVLKGSRCGRRVLERRSIVVKRKRNMRRGLDEWEGNHVTRKLQSPVLLFMSIVKP
jgi:hypothetical protein